MDLFFELISFVIAVYWNDLLPEQCSWQNDCCDFCFGPVFIGYPTWSPVQYRLHKMDPHPAPPVMMDLLFEMAILCCRFVLKWMITWAGVRGKMIAAIFLNLFSFECSTTRLFNTASPWLIDILLCGNRSYCAIVPCFQLSDRSSLRSEQQRI